MKHWCKREYVLALLLSLICTFASYATAQSDEKQLKIGLLTDLSGVYADYFGEGSVTAAKLANEDVGGKAAGREIKLLIADHLGKPDVGAAITRRWIDQDGVDVILDVPNSSVALAVNEVIREKNKVL